MDTYKIKRWQCIPKKVREFIKESSVNYMDLYYHEKRYTYVLYHNKKVIGYAYIEANEDTSYIYEMEIKEEYRSNGCGKTLVDHILKTHSKISLEALQHSVKFWRKIGFKKWDKAEYGLTPMANY